MTWLRRLQEQQQQQKALSKWLMCVLYRVLKINGPSYWFPTKFLTKVKSQKMTQYICPNIAKISDPKNVPDLGHGSNHCFFFFF